MKNKATVVFILLFLMLQVSANDANNVSPYEDASIDELLSHKRLAKVKSEVAFWISFPSLLGAGVSMGYFERRCNAHQKLEPTEITALADLLCCFFGTTTACVGSCCTDCYLKNKKKIECIDAAIKKKNQ